MLLPLLVDNLLPSFLCLSQESSRRASARREDSLSHEASARWKHVINLCVYVSVMQSSPHALWLCLHPGIETERHALYRRDQRSAGAAL
ncbi:hypothetical protein FDR95_21180 [Rhizobiaceae bacterium LC148]|nr:hypothetical protein FDR95_21180 [Rhizobiaceae bacterium LC148]